MQETQHLKFPKFLILLESNAINKMVHKVLWTNHYHYADDIVY